MESNSLSPEPSSITNILTLRYDPSITPNLPRKTSNDFKLPHEENSIKFIENTIVKTLRRQLDTSSVRKTCIALSGGIDSTLILTLIKKAVPDIQVHAISVKFANSIDETESAARIATELGADHHVIQIENYLRELPKAISIIKLPFGIFIGTMLSKNHSLFQNISLLVMVEMSYLEGIHLGTKNFCL